MSPKLGPEGYNKIAVLGTAASSLELAPFNDQSFAIWACSPGAYPVCAKNRSDVWFEPHRWLPTAPGKLGAAGTKPWFSPEFHAFLKAHKGPVFMTEKHEDIPTSVPIPYAELRAKYGPYFWTSTLAYMIAMAIDDLMPRAQAGEQVAIGLWGVDMAANEEWAYQRPGCQHFIGLAMSVGINVILPEETDLMRPPTMYGIGEHHPRHIRLLARRAEIEAHRIQLVQQQDATVRSLMTVTGQLSEIDYVLSSWTDEVETDLRRAISFSGEFVKPVGAATKTETEAPKPESTGATVLTMNDAAR